MRYVKGVLAYAHGGSNPPFPMEIKNGKNKQNKNREE